MDNVYAGYNLLPVDGSGHYLSDKTWVNLNDQYGYVPLVDTSFYLKRTLNKGTTFLNININHGENPESRAYAYALLPGADQNETAVFSSDPGVSILSMTDSMHAVCDETSQIVQINVFEPGQTLLGLTFYDRCAVIIDSGMFYVSDPTLTSESVRIGFDKSVEVVSDTSVSIDEDNIVTVDMPIGGKTYSFEAVGY